MNKENVYLLTKEEIPHIIAQMYVENKTLHTLSDNELRDSIVAFINKATEDNIDFELTVTNGNIQFKSPTYQLKIQQFDNKQVRITNNICYTGYTLFNLITSSDEIFVINLQTINDEIIL